MDKASEAAALEGSSENPTYAPGFRLKCAKRAAGLYAELRAEQEAKLRELLTYLESQDPRDEDGDSELGYYERQYEGPAYRDAAIKLKRILDGE